MGMPQEITEKTGLKSELGIVSAISIVVGVVLGAGVLAFVAVVNSISVRAAGKVQMVATACKLVPIALLTIFGLWMGNGKVLSATSGVSAATT